MKEINIAGHETNLKVKLHSKDTLNVYFILYTVYFHITSTVVHSFPFALRLEKKFLIDFLLNIWPNSICYDYESLPG